jgi:hypothetical protein
MKSIDLSFMSCVGKYRAERGWQLFHRQPIKPPVER